MTYSTVENFDYQTWKDFSDLRLIEPSPEYPVIEVEIVLNFFPGDQSTAEKYKLFVQKLTKTHSGKDSKISIDDYFHIEDQKEWTFFIGNKSYITPWWEKTPTRLILSCIFLIGWPFRYLAKLILTPESFNSNVEESLMIFVADLATKEKWRSTELK